MEAFERDYLTQLLTAHHGNVSQAAKLLGINRTTLYKKMKRLGLEAPPHGATAQSAIR